MPAALAQSDSRRGSKALSTYGCSHFGLYRHIPRFNTCRLQLRMHDYIPLPWIPLSMGDQPYYPKINISNVLISREDRSTFSGSYLSSLVYGEETLLWKSYSVARWAIPSSIPLITDLCKLCFSQPGKPAAEEGCAVFPACMVLGGANIAGGAHVGQERASPNNIAFCDGLQKWRSVCSIDRFRL